MGFRGNLEGFCNSIFDVKTRAVAVRKVTSKSFFLLPSRRWKIIRYGARVSASTSDSTRLSIGYILEITELDLAR